MHAIGFGPRFVVNRQGQRDTVFDFSGGVLPPGASLSRGSAATSCDASGAVVGAAADVARFDYRAGRLRGLLVEPARTNALPASTDWTNGFWTPFSVNVTVDTLIESAGASAAHLVRPQSGAIAYVAGQSLTLSAIAAERSGSAKRYLLLMLGSPPVFTGSTLAIFDLATGVVTASLNADAAGCEAIGGPGANPWLCWLSATPIATSAPPFGAFVKVNGSATVSNSYAGDGTSGLYLSYVQLETATTATSRIVTGAGAATRAADALVLDWRSRGVADGTIAVRYAFDDGSTQDVATTVAGGTATVPTSLARRWILRAQKL